jgi:glutathione S-transferase
MTQMILHHYWPSPFAHKIRMVFGLADVGWRSVEIPRVPPKPLLVPLTGGYRRTPVLQIGADVFCDTQNIVRAIGEAGFEPKIFPNGCEAPANLVAAWIDQAVFNLAARVIITNSLDTAPAEFISDRGDLYFGSGWTEAQLKRDLSGVILQLHADLSMIDRAIGPVSGMCSTSLSYADVAVAYLAWFIRGRWESGPDFLSGFMNICRIETLVGDLGDGSHTSLSAEEALSEALRNESNAPRGIYVNATDLEIGQLIMIKPQGESSDPVVSGLLRYLDCNRVSIDHFSDDTGKIAVHFPVSGYRISAGD